MNMIEDCWEKLDASDCTFGPHLFRDSIARIYIADGLDVADDLWAFFPKRSVGGRVGHCVAVFYGVESFEFTVTEYEQSNGRPIWLAPIDTRYTGGGSGSMDVYHLGGGLLGFSAYVSVKVKAQRFCVHALELGDAGIVSGVA